jgi:hypothetical protein
VTFVPTSGATRNGSLRQNADNLAVFDPTGVVDRLKFALGSPTITGDNSAALQMNSGGTSSVILQTVGGVEFEALDLANVVRHLTAQGAAAGNNPILSASAGNVQIGTATVNAVLLSLLDISAGTAGQIKFPTVRNLSADAHTLDACEKGTWTPSVGGNATYNVQSGSYTRIGRLVFINARLSINVLGTGSTTTVTGLPFGDLDVFAGCNFLINGFSGLATAVVSLVGETGSSSSATIQITSRTAAAVTTSLNAIFANGAQVDICGIYHTGT